MEKSDSSLSVPCTGELFKRNCVAHLSNSFCRFIYGACKFLSFYGAKLMVGVWKSGYGRFSLVQGLNFGMGLYNYASFRFRKLDIVQITRC